MTSPVILPKQEKLPTFPGAPADWDKWPRYKQDDYLKRRSAFATPTTETTADRQPRTYTPNSKAAALAAKIKEVEENISALQELWLFMIGKPVPEADQFKIWLMRYGFEITAAAIEELASWINKHKQELAKIRAEGREPTPEEIVEHSKTMLDLVRYASGIMKKMKADQEEK
jgi:dsDNA-binding SOS-regulon protein